MKYIVILGDGMADYPLEELGGKTPLQAADKPNIDFIAEEGKSGMLRTIPAGMDPGSDVANLSILGYDPCRYYSGRAPLEAASIGVKLGDDEVAFRCNLITEENGILADFTAGHITSEEAKELIGALNESGLGAGKFYAGVSYRHLFVCDFGEKLKCTPPHDVVSEPIDKVLIKPENAESEVLNKLMHDSKKVLEGHEVNKKRMVNGRKPANMIWLWGQGKKPELELFKDKYGLNGAVISAVDLIKGIGISAGMDVLNVPGATGFYDTVYENKAKYALKALKDHDYVYVHVEAPDEAAHSGDLELKIKTIEDLDRRLVGRVLDAPGECAVAILPDHATPVKVKTHTGDAVPFAIMSPFHGRDNVERFDERSAGRGGFGKIEGGEFMKLLLGK